MHHQITLIGPIGSGKTTASQYLAKSLGLPLLDADLYEENPFLEQYIEDTPRWSFATELYFTIARIKKLLPLREILRKKSVVVDSGLIMSHQVYAKNHLVQGTMTAAEWNFWELIIADYKQAIPTPNIVIHITCSPKTQLKRIKARGRSFEAGYSLEYLQNITDRLTEYSDSLDGNKSIKLLTFDSEKYDITQESGQKELLSQVTSLLAR